MTMQIQHRLPHSIQAVHARRDCFSRGSERQSGFSIVELMVAMVLSILVVGGVVYTYTGVSQANRSQHAAARLLENGRTAMELISRDLRLAGYWECVGWQLANLSNHLATSQRGLFGTDGSSGAPDTIRSIYALEDTAVTVQTQVTLSELNLLAIPPSVTANDISVSSGSGFSANDYIVVNDCGKGDVFQISGVTGNTLEHNCTTCVETYDVNSSVLQVQDVLYFIANNSNSQPALFRSYDNGTTSEELLEGVEDMQIMYGEDTDSDGVANRYVTADVINAPCAAGTNPSCWLRVPSVRISLLLRTTDDYVSQDPQTYVFNGQTVTATDNRLRQEFTSVIFLRNHKI